MTHFLHRLVARAAGVSGDPLVAQPRAHPMMLTAARGGGAVTAGAGQLLRAQRLPRDRTRPTAEPPPAPEPARATEPRLLDPAPTRRRDDATSLAQPILPASPEKRASTRVEPVNEGPGVNAVPTEIDSRRDPTPARADRVLALPLEDEPGHAATAPVGPELDPSTTPETTTRGDSAYRRQEEPSGEAAGAGDPGPLFEHERPTPMHRSVDALRPRRVPPAIGTDHKQKSGPALRSPQPVAPPTPTVHVRIGRVEVGRASDRNFRAPPVPRGFADMEALRCHLNRIAY